MKFSYYATIHSNNYDLYPAVARSGESKKELFFFKMQESPKRTISRLYHVGVNERPDIHSLSLGEPLSIKREDACVYFVPSYYCNEEGEKEDEKEETNGG